MDLFAGIGGMAGFSQLDDYHYDFVVNDIVYIQYLTPVYKLATQYFLTKQKDVRLSSLRLLIHVYT